MIIEHGLDQVLRDHDVGDGAEQLLRLELPSFGGLLERRASVAAASARERLCLLGLFHSRRALTVVARDLPHARRHSRIVRGSRGEGFDLKTRRRADAQSVLNCING